MAAGLQRVTVSLDSLDDATFRAMNDVGFPVSRVLDGIDAAAAAGLRVKVNAVVKRGVNDDQIVELARHFRGTGHILRFIEYMDVGATNGWRLDDVVPAAEIVALIDARAPARARRGELPRRGRAALALPRRQRRDRRHRLRHAAVLRRLHAGRASRPRVGLYTCLFATTGPRPPRARPRRRDRRRARTRRSARSGAGASDRYSEIRSSLTKPHRARRDVVHRRLGVATTHCAGTTAPLGRRREAPPVRSAPTPSPSARSRSWSGPRRSSRVRWRRRRCGRCAPARGPAVRRLPPPADDRPRRS